MVRKKAHEKVWRSRLEYLEEGTLEADTLGAGKRSDVLCCLNYSYKTTTQTYTFIVAKLLVSIYTTIIDPWHSAASKGTNEATSWLMAVLHQSVVLADSRKQNSYHLCGRSASSSNFFQYFQFPSKAHLSKTKRFWHHSGKRGFDSRMRSLRMYGYNSATFIMKREAVRT